MNDLTFEPFPKIGRLQRKCTITEKIDGTNGQIVFDDTGAMLVGSRKREIWPEGTPGRDRGCDNLGFAAWAYKNQFLLWACLGPGRHYGEWAGGKIQRGYGGLPKRFYLFNTFRWDNDTFKSDGMHDFGLYVVPVLYEGQFDMGIIADELRFLNLHGSHLTKEFREAEGLVIYHHGTCTYSKITCLEDERGKGRDAQSPS